MAHPQILFGAVMLLVIVFVEWLFWMLPLWSRPGIFFAVTVVPEFRSSSEAARILRNYRIQTLLSVAIAFALVVIGALSLKFAFLILGIVWLMVGPLFSIARAHKNAMLHAIATPTIREASLTPRSAQLPGGWLLQLCPFAIMLITAVYIAVHWQQIPDRFPVHWGVDGKPNGWSDRSVLGAYGPLIVGFAVSIGLSIIVVSFSYLARHIPTTGDLPSKGDLTHRIAIFLLGIEFFLAAMFSLAALLPFTGNPGLAPIVVLVIGLGGSAIFLRGWISRGASRSIPADGTPDNCWKLGLFYFNPDDSALFVEKRIGIGYTVNFARASAWICLALILFLPIFLLFLILQQH